MDKISESIFRVQPMDQTSYILLTGRLSAVWEITAWVSKKKRQRQNIKAFRLTSGDLNINTIQIYIPPQGRKFRVGSSTSEVRSLLQSAVISHVR